jgi:hypothetical protein
LIRWKVALALDATPARPSSAIASAARNELVRRLKMISLDPPYERGAEGDCVAAYF